MGQLTSYSQASITAVVSLTGDTDSARSGSLKLDKKFLLRTTTNPPSVLACFHDVDVILILRFFVKQSQAGLAESPGLGPSNIRGHARGGREVILLSAYFYISPNEISRVTSELELVPLFHNTVA